MKNALAAVLAALATLGAIAAGCSSSNAENGALPAGTDAGTDGPAVCTSRQVRCGASCVALDSDHDNCGSCGAACGDAQLCRAGLCGSCADFALDTCGSACTDLLTDALHCGACDEACEKGKACVNGGCVEPCGDAGLACGSACVEVASDSKNCGACGNACGAGQTCSAGKCECANAALVGCATGCVDPHTDAKHCGASLGCGTSAGFAGEACLANGYCKDSRCQLCQTWTRGFSVDLGDEADAIDVAVQDFNKDGKVDIALLERTASMVHIYLGNGDGTFRVGSVISSGSSSRSMVVADLDGDTKLDIAIANAQPTNFQYITLLMGKGDGTFVAGPEVDPGVVGAGGAIDPPVPVARIAIGDFNGDGRPDLVVGGDNQTSSQVRVFLRKADGTYKKSADYGPTLLVALGASTGAFATSDIDGDGHIDLVVNGDGPSAGILFGDGTGALTMGWISPLSAGGGQGGLALADLDGDGKVDLARGDADGVTVFTGRGGRSFTPGVHHAFGGSTSLRAIDVTGDSRLDLVGTGPETPAFPSLTSLGIRAGTTDGNFLAEVDFPFEANVTGPLSVVDINGDGRLDVVGATYRGLRVLLGSKSSAPECP